MCKCRSHGTFPLFGLQSSHLNICYYHQDPHRRPLRPGSRPGFCSDRRALLLIGAWPLPRRPGIGRALQRHPFSGLVDSADERFARQYRCGPPPEFPLASPRSGIVHHLSGPDRYAHSNPSQKIKVGRRCTPRGDRVGQLPCASRVYSPVDSHMSDSLVRVSRRVEWGARWPAPGARSCRGTPEARAVRHDRGDGIPRAYRLPGLWPPPQSALVRAPSRSADRLSPFHIRPGRIAGPHPLPSRQFQALFDSLFKVLFIFPSRYLFAIGLSPVFSLGRNLPPDWGCIPKQPDSPTAPRGATGSGHDGALTLSGAPFQGTWARSAAEDASPDYNSDSEAARFSSWAIPGAGAFGSNVTPRADDGTTARELRVQPPLVVTSVAAGIAFGPAARDGAREANLPPPAPGEGGDAMRDAQADVPWPNGFGRNLRSKTRWFTGFCNSHQVSHFATFFIDARAEISVAESRFDIRETSPPPVHPANGGLARRTLR
ncbi:UNVERIFIED_CONTAM: hypothetical protein Slati_4592400 [Sesamum latifolium]|uniref:Uncharacterized protein n=1 Tax=Sesamum latifolium TaxID=2727402 RepID=A0AAW2S221_9LAMI